MRNTQLLLFDYILIAAVALQLAVAAVALFRLLRKGERQQSWLVAVSVIGAALLVFLFVDRITDAITFSNQRKYPEYPRVVLAGGMVAVALVVFAAYDSVSTRAGQLGRRFVPHSLTPFVVPLLLLGTTVVLAGALLVLEPEDPQVVSTGPPPPRPSQLDLVPTASVDTLVTQTPPNLVLSAITEPGDLQLPTYLTSHPNDDRLFILERLGRVRVMDQDGLWPEAIIDVSEHVGPGDDGGLIGIALHPDYPSNGRIFIHYTDTDDDNQILEYRLDPATATPTGDDPKVLLQIEQPTGFHAGGMLQFGPDGMLYIGIGEGSTYGTGRLALDRDPERHGQNPDTMLGTILRIDVDGAEPYAVPADNAFDGRAPNETYAYGVRNPYRFWIDEETDGIYIGDVGQVSWEEIDFLPLGEPGHNFGWDITEGSGCYLLGDEFVHGCDRTGLTPPIFEYRNFRANSPGQEGGGCAVILGPLYRGVGIPDLDGALLYADYCSSWIGGFRYGDGAVTDSVLWEPTGGLSLGTPLSFGVDGSGEVYLLTSADGMIYHITQG